MKTMGIIRRIDDLGRVAIPKELRKKMNITLDDCIIFYFNEDDNSITMKKFNPENE